MPTTTAYSKTITIKSGSTVVATGTLAISVTTNPPNPVTATGTFTPAQTTTPITLTSSSLTWTSTSGRSVVFAFNVTGSAIGAFPVGSYTFTGTQQANGNPTGTVVWPSAAQSDEESDEDSDEDSDADNAEGIEPDTWQASG